MGAPLQQWEEWPFIEPPISIVGNSALHVKRLAGIQLEEFGVLPRKVLKKMQRSGIKETPFQTVDGVGCF
jgi:hypothetical protein